MRRARGRTGSQATAVVLLLCGAANTLAADRANDGTGLPGGLGAGAVAVADMARGAFGNPALLLGTERLEAFGSLSLDATGSPLQRLSLRWPQSPRGALAFGYARVDARAAGGVATRDEWSLAAAMRPARRFGLGATLRLRDESAAGNSEPSFGIDVGAHASPVGDGADAATMLEVGARFANVVRPQRLGAGGNELEPRGLEAAVACTRRFAPDWRATATLALETATGADGAAWLGGRIAWRRGLEVAIASRGDAWRAGIGASRGGVGIEYGVAGDDATRHSLALRCGFGTSAQQRVATAERRAETRMSERLVLEIAARQAHEVETWLAVGREALSAHDYDRAAEGFRNVLLWQPDHAVARSGLRGAQLGTMLQQADSLIARRDYWSASSQLEHAVRLFPEDSLATARLQEVRGVVNRADRSRSEAAEQFRLGLDAFATQHYNAAIRCFDAALALDASNRVAAEFAARSRQAQDTQVQAALQQARGRLERRDAEGARSALLSALDAAPGHPDAARLLAQVDRDLERQAQDRRLAETRRQELASREDRAPSPAARPALASTYERGMAMYRAGDLTAAMQAWEDVARKAPHFEEVDQYLLRVYRVVGLESYTEGRLQDAIVIWSKALQLEPENPQVRRYMDQANAKLQRSRGAR